MGSSDLGRYNLGALKPDTNDSNDSDFPLKFLEKTTNGMAIG